MLALALKKKKRPLNRDASTKMLEKFTGKSSLCIGELPGGEQMVLQDVGVTSNMGLGS